MHHLRRDLAHFDSTSLRDHVDGKQAQSETDGEEHDGLKPFETDVDVEQFEELLNETGRPVGAESETVQSRLA